MDRIPYRCAGKLSQPATLCAILAHFEIQSPGGNEIYDRLTGLLMYDSYLAKSVLTFFYPLIQLTLYKTLFGVRKPCSRFSFSGQPFRPLLVQNNPRARPLESTTYEMLIL
jgi:hypothetical protein